MPEFQMAYEYGLEKSPNLVTLAEYDGGLYGLLCTADPWFDDLFLSRFPRSSLKYKVGRSMILLDRADLLRLERTLSTVAFPKACQAAKSRLMALVDRCLSADNGVLAVSESG